jgi:nucleoside phosphorylase
VTHRSFDKFRVKELAVDDFDFAGLYARLNRASLTGRVEGPITDRSTTAELSTLIDLGREFLPSPFRLRYADALRRNLPSLMRRLSAPNGGIDVLSMETFVEAVHQHANLDDLPQLQRFLAVLSNMYRSFLDSSKRARFDIELTSALPPVAMFHSDSGQGPFTITSETVARLFDASVGVVSLPRSFAGHPLLFGSLAHEAGGHDVIHADATLLTELKAHAHQIFDGPNAKGLGLLWDYWMDEAAADVYGVLNVGPMFGFNLALLLAVFVGQINGLDPVAPPSLRTDSGADERGVLDPHPADILRLSLVQGAVEALARLAPSTRQTYVNRLAGLAHMLAPEARVVGLTGYARVPSGESMSFDGSLPIATLQESARAIGGMIASVRLAALDGRAIQEIETWDDADENAAVTMAGRLGCGTRITGLGDDAQIIAALTIAALRAPEDYELVTELANQGLDESFYADPYWGAAQTDMLFLSSGRSGRDRELNVDRCAAYVIDFNPLDVQAGDVAFGISPVTRVEIEPIEWPANGVPKIDNNFTFRGPNAELPKADVVIFTWTSAEANAMSAVLTPGIWAMPRSGSEDQSWHEYTNQWASKFAGRSTAKGPASINHYIGKFMPVVINEHKVLLFKSNFHLARDDLSLPVKDMFKQVLEQTGARLAITTGTAGAIGSELDLGDVVVTNRARFKLDGPFNDAPFNLKSYKGSFAPRVTSTIELVNAKLVVANAAVLRSSPIPPRHVAPRVFLPRNMTAVGEPAVIITTDSFEYDDVKDSFGLQGKGAMVEMDDAVLALACEELDAKIAWLAIRNASDPQMPADATKETSAEIYARYGYWTSIPSVLASWAMAYDFE